MSGTCTSVGASLCWPGKWAREATLVPRPHVTLKLDIRICFGTPDVFFVITIFSTLTCPIYKILPGQVSGPERFILALNHISFFSHSLWYCRVTTYLRVSPKGERLRNLLSQSIFQFATLLLLGGADFGPTDTFFGVFFALI